MNILITRHDKIGDFITALPMCKVLKKQTNHNIIMLVSSINVQLAKKLDFIDDVIEYTSDNLVLLKRLSRYKFDISISGYIDFNLGLTLFLARIPIRIAPSTKIAQIFFNKKIKQRRSEVKKKEWEYNLDLLKAFDKNLKLEFTTPLLQIQSKPKNFIIFHPGFGGSSDGNLTLDDYLNLAKSASKIIDVIFTFGPDDRDSKEYIEKKLDFNASIRDDFNSLWDFTQFIATCKLFVSTSTGPMHLAGLINKKTLSFFGEDLFSSSKRWATISDDKMQNNFELPKNYDRDFYLKIENRLLELIK